MSSSGNITLHVIMLRKLLIFIRIVMEKSNPPYLLAVTKKDTNPQCKKLACSDP
jgi:hypothetical protein